MRTLSLDTGILQKGLGLFAVLYLTLSSIITPSLCHAAQNLHVKILYFFSPSCPHCVEAAPAVISLGKEYNIEGHNVGAHEAQEGYPFPVIRGDKKNARKVYGIRGIPSLAVIIDGVFKQKLEGASDIQDAKSIVRALSSGAMTVTEAAKKEKDVELTVAGWVVAQGEYFKNVRFILTDRTTEIPVKAWLPLEAMKSPMKKSMPRLMSNVLRKPVVLRGNLIQTGTGPLFVVKEELRSY
jgi:thiol-disulfide isomerase/thioredoxin